MLNPVAPYLFMADIANPDLFVCSFRTWICLDITRFYEEQRQPSSWSAGPAFPKTLVNRAHIAGAGGFDTFAQHVPNAVTALVGCVIWSHQNNYNKIFQVTDNQIKKFQREKNSLLI